MHRLSVRFAASSFIGAFLLAACGGGGGEGGTNPPPAPVPLTGTLAVSLTDAPACGFDAVNVTVSKVRVHQSANAGEADAGWIDIALATPRKINLLNLTNGALDALGTTTLAAGKYSQVRLHLDPNTGTGLANSVLPSPVPGTLGNPGNPGEQTLDTPSAVQSGIKIMGEFDVVAGQRTELVLDFDACKSVVTRGNGRYALKPVVKLVPAALNGITGFISTNVLRNDVLVSAQQDGTIVASAAPNPATGEFRLARLVPGNYDVVITAAGSSTAVVAGVPVGTSTSTTALSTAAAPIALTPSLSGRISGAVTLTGVAVTEAAYVSARQRFAAGPIVTVRYKGADLLSGNYVLDELPLAAPRLAAYSANLPLVFTASDATVPGTGRYRVDAAALGYTSKSVAGVDISVSNQFNVNFLLLP